MTTRYILQSGGTRNAPEKMPAFFAEVFRDCVAEQNVNPVVLLVFFAQQREKWEGKFMQEQENFPSLCPDPVKPSLELAMPEHFVEQCRRADIIYCLGGDDHLCQYWLNQFDLQDIWRGKTVVTNSASSNILTNAFWTCDWRQPLNGLGLIDAKFISHYRSESYDAGDPRGPIDWDAAYKELEAFDGPGEIYALEEGDFAVFEQS